MRRRREVLATAMAAGLAVGVLGCSAGSPGDDVRSATRVVPDSTGSPPGAAAPASTAAPGSGPLGLKWSWAQPATFDFVAAARGGWTFFQIEWCDVQPSPGEYDWSTVDQVVRDARDLGYEIMLKLRTGQCWATESPSAAQRDPTENAEKDPSTPTTDMRAYLAFVRTAVQRYAARGVDDYAVENEPDVVNLWAASISDYRRLAVLVAREVHDAHPGAHVLDGGTSSTAYGVAMAAAQVRRHPQTALHTYRAFYGRRIAGGASRWPAVDNVRELRQVLRSAPGRRAVRSVDVAVRLANSGVVDGFQLHYYEPTHRLPSLLRFLDDRLRDRVPVEAWEVGVAWPGSGYDEHRQAQEVYRLVALLLGDDIRRVVYLPVAYSPAADKVPVFRGLTLLDGGLLPAGSGWSYLAGALGGLRGAAIDDAAGRLRGVTWSIRRQQVALVWARRGEVRLDPADVTRVVDASGTVQVGDPVVGRRPVLVIGSQGGELARRVSQGGY